MSASDPQIQVTREGPVATIWLNRPAKRNAMNCEMWLGLEAAALELASANDVRVVVLHGRGQHFCAGADITQITVGRDDHQRSFSQVNLAAEEALATMPKPTVALVSGDCIGGGCALAIDCDIRIATADARFGITPAKLGIVYPAASLARATHLLGPAATKRLLFTADLIDTAEAVRIGLVDEVVADAEERLSTLTSGLAARSLLTQAATKSMVAAIVAHGDVPAALLDYWNAQAASAADSTEGIAAFVEKRPARFTWSGPR